MWIFYALFASILWGIDYSLTESTLHHIKAPTLLTIELFVAFVVMFALALRSGSFAIDLITLRSFSQTTVFVGLIALVFTTANFLIVLSIGAKSATLSGLIEISYPLFIALFSWLFFRENALNLWTSMGGVLIILGVLVIYCFGK